ncbi:MAG TPA: tetratricopeptide repeat protein [Gammaproteobacteria bacterium]|nr:tetratricopeptide repeat protein [Gammaproteobacteria bacterium]
MKSPGTTARTTRKRANALLKAGKLDEARDLFFSLCRYSGSDTDSWLALADISYELRAFGDAEFCARKVLSISSDSEAALLALGKAVQRQGRMNEAIHAYQQVLEKYPASTDARFFLGGVHLQLGQMEAAALHYRKVLELSPDHVQALNNLSAIFTNQGKIYESLDLLERALARHPDGEQMLINLARAHLFSGSAMNALGVLKKVVSLHPGSAEANSKYLLCRNYVEDANPEMLAQEHIRWSELHTGGIKRHHDYLNNAVTGRRIHIGYVSPDLKAHSVAYFMEPVLARHNNSGFQVTCYADITSPDDTSARLASACDNWKLTRRLTDQQLAELIRTDKIDILVDLAGHTANNRLLLFASKPAPVQVTYLGYPNTTGLEEIDYRFTDSIADPDAASAFYTETLIRLPNGFLCYAAPASAPEVKKVRDYLSRDITFGSFNNLAKVTDPVISTWSRILKAIPASRLVLKSKATHDPYTRARLTGLFEKEGISMERVILTGYVNGTEGHLALYNNIDIALDTFPYNGTTTSCEALWMGTPVVTLSGNTHGSRVGASILSRLDMTDLIARTTDEYVDIAVKLASDKTRLAALHNCLRNTMQASSVCNADLITHDIETAYTAMWEYYCNDRLRKPAGNHQHGSQRTD